MANGFGIKIAPLEGNRTVATKFEGISRRAADMSPAMAENVAAFHAIESRRWMTADWAPLSQATMDRKADGGWPDDPLVRTHTLRGSLTGHGGDSTVISRTFWEVASDVPYAAFHQYGTEHMPARPIIDFTEGDVAIFAEIILGWLIEGTFGNIAEAVVGSVGA